MTHPLPQNWQYIKIEDIADPNIRWSFTGGPFGSNLKSINYTSEGIRIIQLQNIGDGAFLNKYKIFTSVKKANELLSCNIYPGEIILSKMGDPVARACIIPDIEQRYLMASDGIRLVPNKDLFDTFFIFSEINSKYFRNMAESASTGSTRKRIGLSVLRKLKILTPPLPEQQRIVAVLETWDKVIEKLERKIELKKNVKKGLMQQLLTGKKRLPGFSGEWEEVKLGDVTSILSGGTPPTENADYWNGDIIWLTPTEVSRSGKYVSNSEKKISANGLASSSAKIIKAKSLILCSRATIGDCSINTIEVTTNQGFKNLIPKDNLDIEFLYYLINTKCNDLKRISSGSTFMEFSKYELEKLKILLPELREQKSIAKILASADEEIIFLQSKLNMIKDQKTHLLNSLITGRIRTPETMSLPS